MLLQAILTRGDEPIQAYLPSCKNEASPIICLNARDQREAHQRNCRQWSEGRCPGSAVCPILWSHQIRLWNDLFKVVRLYEAERIRKSFWLWQKRWKCIGKDWVRRLKVEAKGRVRWDEGAERWRKKLTLLRKGKWKSGCKSETVEAEGKGSVKGSQQGTVN